MDFVIYGKKLTKRSFINVLRRDIMKLKNLSGGEIVGVGTDFIVILKDKKSIVAFEFL